MIPTVVVRQVFAFFLMFLLSTSLLAAECTEVFRSGNGINEGLPENRRLTFDSDDWPAESDWPESPAVLSSGDYYFDNDDLDNGYVLSIATDAVVRIFVDGDFDIGNNANINQFGQAGQLLLLVNGEVEIGNNAIFNGVLYAENEVDLKNNSVVNGLIGSEDDVDLDKNAVFNNVPEALSPALLGGLCDIGPAGVLPVRDNFESYPPGSIDSRNGGSGWGDTWSGSAGQSIVDTSTNRLEFLASNGLSIRSDTTLEVFGNASRVATRPLSGIYEGETIYVSMLVRFQGTPGNNDFLGFWLQNPSFGDSPQFGIKVNEGGGGQRDFFVRLDTQAAYSTDFQPGQTYLLVARFSKNGRNFYEQGELWVDPQCTDSPPPTPSASIVSSPSTQVAEVSEIGFRSENLSGDARVQVGQVAAGQQWSDVVSCECYQNGLEATYYNNYNRNDPFPETPDLTRLDPVVDFNWGSGPPDPAINSNQFAVQWQGSLEVPVDGEYQFIARTDDGVRLWVDNLDTAIIDDWSDRSVGNSAVSVMLQAGQRYAIRMQYYENGGVAEARLRWRRPNGTEEVIPEQFLFGCLPVAAPRLESAAAVCGSSDLVELTFFENQRSRPLLESSLANTEFYRIERVSDGEPVSVLGATPGQNGYSVMLELADQLSLDDSYRVVVTDLQDVGGVAIEPNPSELEFTAAASGLATQFWNNRNLDGPPVYSEITNQIDNNWGNGSPVPGVINSNQFSVRWSGFIVPPESGAYQFRTRTDDGVRLYVDDLATPVIDEWRDFSPTNHESGDIILERGRSYNIRMEMYENAGGAVAQLSWRRPGQGQFELIPPTAFFQCPDTGGAVDHFRILHGGAGVTCQPTPITFEARNALGDIVTDYAGEVFLSTSTGQGFWQALGSLAGNLTLVPGDSGEASYQFDPADGGVVTLGLKHTQPDTVNLDITDGGVRELTGADPDLVVQRTGFVFHQGNDFSVPIGSQVSGKPSNVMPGIQDLRLTAVRESDTTGSCEAYLTGPQTVNIGQVCESPGNCSAIGAMEVNGTIVGNNSAGNAANSTPVVFDFGDDTNSSAAVNLSYNDSGLISLFAQMPLVDDQGIPTGEIIVGNSGPFPVVPAGFCVEAIDPDLACATVDAECSAGAVAGEIFNLRASAAAWGGAGESGPEFCDNSVTPNFEYADLEIGHRLLAPVTGQPGTILNETVGILPTGEGRRDVNQSVSEVGVFEFFVPTGQPYLGQTLPGGFSAPVGRFTPAGFTVSLNDAGMLGSVCSVPLGFTYVGQSFDWALTPEVAIVPRAADGTTITTNYLINDFMKLSASGVARTAPDSDRTARLADDSALVPIDYDEGIGNVSGDVDAQEVIFRYSNDDSFLVPKSTNTRIPPFTPVLPFSVDGVVDLDGVMTLVSQPMPLMFEPASEGDIRYGRLEMTNVFGPENADQPLIMPAEATYWNGARFVRNTLDNCSSWDTSTPTPLQNEQQFHELQNESETGTLSDGEAPALLLAPTGQRGEERVRWQMPVWLKGYWGREPSGPGDPGKDELQDPEAVATFGVYRGNDRIIYWQEILN
ncbi:hypothetical protein CLH62_19020 [Marinobacter guineae]|uniref:PA14 domain-containing protein n=1 Tax=Marinobacter guineae TaxID=432303 RepID=A0A2G1VAZ4_9GAMM|nr:DUF6701 domain-containing protein [Marinobacter guineae]PHQ23830.1 hypothetical protein CLH62_19020 [Marinobacter guineae]